MRRTQKPPTAAADEKLAALIERQAEADSATDRVAEAVENAKKEQNLASAIVDVINGADPEQVADDLIAAANPPKARTTRTKTTSQAKTEAAATAAPARPVVDAPGMTTTPTELVGTAPAIDAVMTTDAAGLVRVHKATCRHLPKGTEPMQHLPERYFASYCCKPRLLAKAATQEKPSTSAKLARVDELSAKLQADRAAKEAFQQTAPTTTRKSRAAAKQTVSEAS